jgi:hypothetical protein
VVKLPASIALMNVDFTGEKAAACKYCVVSCTFEVSYMLLPISFCRYMYFCIMALIRVLSNGTVNGPVSMYHCPCMTMLPLMLMVPSNTLASPSSNNTLYPASHIYHNARKECCTSPLIKLG